MADQFDFDVPEGMVLVSRDDAEYIYTLVMRNILRQQREGRFDGIPGPIQRLGFLIDADRALAIIMREREADHGTL